MRPDIEIKTGNLYINGKWVAASTSKTSKVIDPSTEAVVAEVAEASVEDANAAVAAAKAAFEQGPWSKMKGFERAKILNRIGDLIDSRAEELAYRECVAMGKLMKDSLVTDIPHIANVFRYFAGWATKLEGSVKPVEGYTPDEKIMAYTRREPLGVVAAITPYNFPLILTVTKIAPALATGNTFIHKPASSTPLSAITLAEIMEEAGVPAGVYNLVTGPGSTIGNAFTQHKDVAKIAITGSTDTGKQIIRDGASTLKHTTVELGGKAPHLIFADVDIERAAETAFFSAFWNKGEVCMAATRFVVEHSIYDKFVEAFAARAKRAKVGDPFDDATEMGPMSSKGAQEKVLKYIEIGKQEGAKLVCGGNGLKVNGKGYYVEPTIFSNANNKMRICQEEIFGPVVAVIPFKTEDEAIAIANDTPYGLASGVQTNNVKKAIRVAERLQAGTVWTNTWHHYSPVAPFGGYKESGQGREHGVESLESYTQWKTIWLDLNG